ncbi:MAG: acylphosphatase [Gammaproteobacteria bacterium]
MKLCYRCYVFGRVQGVFFRVSTRRQAQELGITGYVRNLPDDRVEVLACGEHDAVNALRDWLWVGPSAARIEDVQCEQLTFQEMVGFSMK